MAAPSAPSRTSIALCTEATGAAETWIHLLPLGTFSGRDGRGPYRLGDAAPVLRQTQLMAGSRAMVVDYEHQTDLAPKNGQPAPAAGWIDALQTRANGIWCRVKWTETASAFLAKREYRYLSPVFHHTTDGTVTCLLRAALTNHPNLELTALARAETPMDPTEVDALLNNLRTLLGLAADATAADILAKVGDLTASAHASQPDPSQFVPIGVLENAVAEVNRLNCGISRQAAEDHVSRQIGHGNLPPALRTWGVALCTVNKPAFDAFVERTRGAFNRIVDPKATGRQIAAQHRATHLSEEERVICERMGVTAEDYAKARAFTETGA